MGYVNAAQRKAVWASKKENYETEEKIMNGLLFSLVVYAVFSMIKKPI